MSVLLEEETSPAKTRPTTECSGEAVATLTKVSKRYKNGVVALNELSLELRRGEIVALLGPNGAGKSTAVKLLLGLSAPTSGQVRIFGADPRETAARSRTGAMLQVGRAPEMLQVREHIEMFRGYYPHPMPYAKLITAAGLEGLERRNFGELSGGQKQRMLFAIALAGNPDLIFLDEPTVGLDIEARRSMWAQIRALAAGGKTILLTTHYLEEADALAHHIIVVNKGHVICEGTPAEVKARGFRGHDADGVELAQRTASFRIIRCITSVPAETLSALPGVVEVTPDADGFTTVAAAEPEKTLRAMLALDGTLHSLEVHSPALEDAFLALTSE